MEKINLILKNIGLTDTETNIYLTGLQYSSIGVNRLEKETKIKRTTIYHAINTLSKKGLVSKKDTGAKLVFMITRKRKKISARSLWESKADKKVLTPEDLKQRQPRILPNIMYGKFKSIIIIFDDKVAIISSLKESSAILIQSREVHDTMLALFDGLWHISKEY